MFGPADVSIVIPTRKRWPTLRLTLDALAAQTATGFELVVVADGMDQDVPADLPGVSRVIRQEHAGPGAARNRGVRKTSRRLIIFIGDDMIPRPGFVEAHVARHNAAPADEVAVLGRIAWHPDVPRNRLHRWLEWSGALFEYEQLERSSDEEAGWGRFYSSNASLKRTLFDAAGGFDPDFTFDYEDLDFGYRLAQEGMRLLYERNAAVDHRHPYDWAAVVQRYESRAPAERLMMSKHGWFKPWFHDRLTRAARQPRASRAWTLLVDRVPRRLRRLRRTAELRANRWYLQQLEPPFMAAWSRAEPTPGSVRSGRSNDS